MGGWWGVDWKGTAAYESSYCLAVHVSKRISRIGSQFKDGVNLPEYSCWGAPFFVCLFVCFVFHLFVVGEIGSSAATKPCHLLLGGCRE